MAVLLSWWEARMLSLRAGAAIVIFIDLWIKMALMVSACKLHQQWLLACPVWAGQITVPASNCAKE
ncbi:hypothetical protein [Janthinobacterium lividum]|uniref:hypothetical protein n=1 Tax=Janthinobacterium lividum TaxID=29581 RepID=UPI00140E103E|nr:hypothetical protein [Janthinobacterium lividum]NHQ93106.1 hypothetical protein [Janthinobacterium lividum]